MDYNWLDPVIWAREFNESQRHANERQYILAASGSPRMIENGEQMEQVWLKGKENNRAVSLEFSKAFM